MTINKPRWVKYGFPWDIRVNYEPEEHLSFPDLSVDMKKEFGFSSREAMQKKYFPRATCWADSKQWKQFAVVDDEIMDRPRYQKLLGKGSDQELDKANAYRIRELKKLKDPVVNKCLEFLDKSKELGEWTDNHPLVKAWNADYDRADKIREDKEKEARRLSFCGAELNKPGTLIEYLVDGKPVVRLIGHLNDLGGVCDDCKAFDIDTVITRYKVIYKAK